MKRKFVTAIVLTAVLAISMCSAVALAKGKPDKPPGKPSAPEVATFSITFTDGHITSALFETEASSENWEPQEVKGRKHKEWAIDHYSITGSFTLEDVLWDPNSPDPLFGLPEYEDDSSVCDFFDNNNPMTISWLDHVYTKETNYWQTALNQTDEATGRNYMLVMDNWMSGTESYHETINQWEATFEDSSCHIHWWNGVFHNVWKGRLSFTVTVQRLSETDN